MKTYIVNTLPTRSDYNEYMSGGYHYTNRKISIAAESREEAAKLAKMDAYYVFINDIKTVEEVQAEKERREEAWRQEKAKREAALTRRKANEERKAHERGMTVEEYRRSQRRASKIKALSAEINALNEAIDHRKAELARLMAEAAAERH